MNKEYLQSFAQKQNYDIGDFVQLVRILRNPDYGCSWDMAQTHESIRHNFVEEVYEALDAIEADDPNLLCEELGDVLLQIMLHTEMEDEQENFDFDAVCDTVCKKLIYRHPHVFADTTVEDTDEVLRNWEDLKKTEKGHRLLSQKFDGVARSLPALMYTKKVQKIAPSDTVTCELDVAVSKLEEMIARLKSDSSDNDTEKKVGEMLFEAVNVTRLLGVDAELCLMNKTKEFMNQVITEKNSEI